MDKVSESMLNEFSETHSLQLPEDKRFEQFAAFITVHRFHPETFDPADVITGSGGDTHIDAIAIVVNGNLVTDLDALEEEIAASKTLDVTFVFVQADHGPNFDSGKLSKFGFGVADFFSSEPKLKRNDKVLEAAEMMSAVYRQTTKFKNGNPACRLYYVTTGKWQNDATLEAYRQQIVSDLEGTALFRTVEVTPVDAASLQKLYRQTKNAIAREFTFANRTVVPDVPGVQEAYLGFLPAEEFLKIIRDDDGEIVNGLFSDNVRDWLDISNEVNTEIQQTLDSEGKSRFVLMNNGITIIARNLRLTGHKFYIEDFSIVNGCQTSHVLFGQQDKLTDAVMVPVRLIGTQDEGVINDIIRATNRQTEVKAEQFYALHEFSKNLEAFFLAYPEQHRLYYERRTRQYHRLPIEKTRIVTPATAIKAYAAMFLEEPHRATKGYGLLKAKVGTEIFAKNHRMEPYYTAAFALYKLDYLIRNYRLDSKYKPARFHILLAARYLANPASLPQVGSNEMERFCAEITERLWSSQADQLIALAAAVISNAAAGDFRRDNIRTESFTEKVLKEIERVQPTGTGG